MENKQNLEEKNLKNMNLHQGRFKMNNDKCLKCKHLDTSDTPNLFCNITSELVNDGDFRFCPKDIKSVLAFIEKQDERIAGLESQMAEFKSQLLAYKNLGTLETLAEDKTDNSSLIETEITPVGLNDISVQITYKNKIFKLNNFELVELARLAGILGDDFVPKKVRKKYEKI